MGLFIQIDAPFILFIGIQRVFADTIMMTPPSLTVRKCPGSAGHLAQHGKQGSTDLKHPKNRLLELKVSALWIHKHQLKR
jgi:hypothetical protein